MLIGPKQIIAVQLFQDLAQQRLQAIVEIRILSFTAKSV